MAANDDEDKLLRSVVLQNASSILIARQRAEQRSEAYLAEAQRLSHTGSFGWRVSTGEIIWSEETFRIFHYDRTTKPTFGTSSPKGSSGRYNPREADNRASREGWEEF